MKKYLIAVCFLVLGCQETSENKGVSFVSYRNEKCLLSAKQVVPSMIEVQCNSTGSWSNVAFCASRLSKIQTVEFNCIRFDDGSWYASKFNTVSFDFKE